MKKKRKHRNLVILSLIQQGLIATLASHIFTPKKGKGAEYNRKENKKIEDE